MTGELATQGKKAPILATSRGIQLSSMEDMYRFATCALNSGMAPKTFGSPEAILIAVQHGMELGLSPAQALQSIAVINGRPSIFGDAALALVKAHREFQDIDETLTGEGESMEAKCIIERIGKKPVTHTFSVADAKKAELWNKAGPWKLYPKRMLQMRARGFAMRDAFPDALKGVGIAEEVRDTEPKQANARVIPAAVLPDEPVIRLDNPDAPVADTGTPELFV
jgi:hypothetical protein